MSSTSKTDGVLKSTPIKPTIQTFSIYAVRLRKGEI